MKGLRLYVASGVLAALAFLCAAYLSIPYAGGGYFNFGDIVILLASGLLGPYAGAYLKHVVLLCDARSLNYAVKDPAIYEEVLAELLFEGELVLLYKLYGVFGV